jgi:hypothetical protein
VDIQPIIPNMMTLQDMTVNLYGFTTPPIPAECAAQYQGQDAWCGKPKALHPRVTTLILASQEVHVAVVPPAVPENAVLPQRRAVRRLPDHV